MIKGTNILKTTFFLKSSWPIRLFRSFICIQISLLFVEEICSSLASDPTRIIMNLNLIHVRLDPRRHYILMVPCWFNIPVLLHLCLRDIYSEAYIDVFFWERFLRGMYASHVAVWSTFRCQAVSYIIHKSSHKAPDISVHLCGKL